MPQLRGVTGFVLIKAIYLISDEFHFVFINQTAELHRQDHAQIAQLAGVLCNPTVAIPLQRHLTIQKQQVLAVVIQ